MEEARSLSLVIYSEIRLYREGLQLLLSARPPLSVLGCAASLDEAIGLVDASRPRIVLVDMCSAGAMRVSRALFRAGGQVGIVALGVSHEQDESIRCARNGCLGFVPRDADVVELVAAVEHVSRGELMCSPRIAAGLARRIAEFDGGTPVELDAALSAREREILSMLDRGLANKQIARQLRLSVSTVKNHVHSVLAKLGSESRYDAARIWRASTS